MKKIHHNCSCEYCVSSMKDHVFESLNNLITDSKDSIDNNLHAIKVMNRDIKDRLKSNKKDKKDLLKLKKDIQNLKQKKNIRKILKYWCFDEDEINSFEKEMKNEK